MTQKISYTDRCRGALYGMFIGDALAMPVHWYYNTLALRMDYGVVRDYLTPRNPHPDSILYRSRYIAASPKTDILHEQARYWGKHSIHYHQFLRAGENTLNLKLAHQLLELIKHRDGYSTDAWLQRMIEYLITPGNHDDTYAEEYLRHFFTNLGKGQTPRKCGRTDEKHIGGFALMLPLLISLSSDPEKATAHSLEHLSLTHDGELMQQWGKFLCIFLLHLLHGDSCEPAFRLASTASSVDIDFDELKALVEYPDETVVCRHFSSACYVQFSVPATMYLALKYSDSPEEGLIANTMCGGDNCGRGAVLGAIFGALHGMGRWPGRWVENLTHPPQFDKNINNL